MGKITTYLQQRRYEKQKKFWKNAIIHGEFYNEYEQEWELIPKAAFTLFTDHELHMIYIEREYQEQELKKLMEQLE